MRHKLDPQVTAWINNNKHQWEFWTEVLRRGTWSGLGKTKDEVENLVGYFEGCYDMSLKFNQLISEKLDTQLVQVDEEEYDIIRERLRYWNK